MTCLRYIIVSMLMSAALHCQQLPDAPSVRWYQRTFTPRFTAMTILYGASLVADAEVTHEGIARHHCLETNPSFPRRPSRGDLYSSFALEFGIAEGIAVLVQSRHYPKKIGWLAYVAPSFETQVHVRAALTWATEKGCW